MKIVFGRNGQALSSGAHEAWASRFPGEHPSDLVDSPDFPVDSSDTARVIALFDNDCVGSFTPTFLTRRFRICKHEKLDGAFVVTYEYRSDDGDSDPEGAYVALVRRILTFGAPRGDRTGTGTVSLFGERLEFDLTGGVVPLLTTKFVSHKTVLHELLWFLRGDTDVRKLHASGVRIWDGNTSREFLDASGLSHLREHDAGAIYSWQWRSWGVAYPGADAAPPPGPARGGFDQLSWVVSEIRRNPESRRLVVSAWDPSQRLSQCLPACHTLFQFYVRNGALDCMMTARGLDTALGLPYNAFSYATLVCVVAKMTGLVPGRLIFSIGDAHVYSDHVDKLASQIERTRMPSPILLLSDSIASKTFDELSIDDFSVVGYVCHPPVKLRMAV